MTKPSVPPEVAVDAGPAPLRSPDVRSYNARQGRMSALTTDTFDRLGPHLLLDPACGFDPASVFGAATPVVVEIGCGFGEATTAMAAAEPQLGIVAIDVHTRGIARLLQRVEADHLTNVRAVHGDAVPFLRDQVPPASLAGARIYFPDPWPKARHLKRRLVQRPFVDLLASRLTSGAVLHCATDWEPYARQMLDVLGACPLLANTVPGFSPRPSWRPMTRYEAAGIQKGHQVHDLVFVRR